MVCCVERPAVCCVEPSRFVRGELFGADVMELMLPLHQANVAYVLQTQGYRQGVSGSGVHG